MMEEEDSIPVYDMGMYSQAQLKALFWVSYPPLLMTTAGSSLIIYLTIQKLRKNATATLQQDSSSSSSSPTFQRIMLGLSACDWIAGAGSLVFKNWSVPTESGLAYRAVGNFTTCSVSGFFTNFLIGSILYTTSLALYFVLKVRGKMSDHRLAQQVEPWFHVVSIFVTLGTGVAGIIMEAFNPFDELAGFCWIGDYPPGCSRPYRNDLPDCIRGGDVFYLAKLLASGTMALGLSLITICMALIIAHVWSTERKMRQYATTTSGQRPVLKMTRQTSVQAFLYMGCFFLTMAPLVVVQMSPKQESTQTASYYFPLCLVTEFLSPLHGFFNAFIYLRPHHGMHVQQRRRTTWLIEQVANAWSRMSNHESRQISSWRRTNSYDTDNFQSAEQNFASLRAPDVKDPDDDDLPEELTIEQLAGLDVHFEEQEVASDASFGE